jgi:hypothetical protein
LPSVGTRTRRARPHPSRTEDLRSKDHRRRSKTGIALAFRRQAAGGRRLLLRELGQRCPPVDDHALRLSRHDLRRQVRPRVGQRGGLEQFDRESLELDYYTWQDSRSQMAAARGTTPTDSGSSRSLRTHWMPSCSRGRRRSSAGLIAGSSRDRRSRADANDVASRSSESQRAGARKCATDRSLMLRPVSL